VSTTTTTTTRTITNQRQNIRNVFFTVRVFYYLSNLAPSAGRPDVYYSREKTSGAPFTRRARLRRVIETIIVGVERKIDLLRNVTVGLFEYVFVTSLPGRRFNVKSENVCGANIKKPVNRTFYEKKKNHPPVFFVCAGACVS